MTSLRRRVVWFLSDFHRWLQFHRCVRLPRSLRSRSLQETVVFLLQSDVLPRSVLLGVLPVPFQDQADSRWTNVPRTSERVLVGESDWLVTCRPVERYSSSVLSSKTQGYRRAAVVRRSPSFVDLEARCCLCIRLPRRPSPPSRLQLRITDIRTNVGYTFRARSVSGNAPKTWKNNVLTKSFENFRTICWKLAYCYIFRQQLTRELRIQMLTITLLSYWYRVVCIAYFVISNYILIDIFNQWVALTHSNLRTCAKSKIIKIWTAASWVKKERGQ